MYVELSTVFATILFYKFNSYARFYIKYILFGFFACMALILPLPLLLLRPRDCRNGVIGSALFIWMCKLIGLTTNLEGRENLIRNSGCVTIMNHQSVVDILAVAVLWIHTKNIVVIASRHILYWYQPFSFFLWLCGAVFLDKKNPENARKSLNQTVDLINNKKQQMIIFPEGERNFSDKKLLPFRKGAFHLAIESKCLIQPVVLNPFTFLGKHKFDEGVVRIRVLPPISTEGCTKENVNDLMEKAYNQMLENLEQNNI